MHPVHQLVPCIQVAVWSARYNTWMSKGSGYIKRTGGYIERTGGTTQQKYLVKVVDDLLASTKI